MTIEGKCWNHMCEVNDRHHDMCTEPAEQCIKCDYRILKKVDDKIERKTEEWEKIITENFEVEQSQYGECFAYKLKLKNEIELFFYVHPTYDPDYIQLQIVGLPDEEDYNLSVKYDNLIVKELIEILASSLSETTKICSNNLEVYEETLKHVEELIK